jgi:hypothetical protein
MIKKGLWLNVVSTVITMVVYFIRPYLWNFQIDEYPTEWEKWFFNRPD